MASHHLSLAVDAAEYFVDDDVDSTLKRLGRCKDYLRAALEVRLCGASELPLNNSPFDID